MAGIVAADRIAKICATRWVLPREIFPVLPLFQFQYVENSGAAFGIGIGHNGFIAFLTALSLAGFLYLQTVWARKNDWVQFGLVFLAAGAAGNLVDRLVHGAVIVFLDFRIWPVFNLADIFIVIGACCWVWGRTVEEGRSSKESNG